MIVIYITIDASIKGKSCEWSLEKLNGYTFVQFIYAQIGYHSAINNN